MTDMPELRRKAEEARDALYAAESAERDKKYAALVGKCYVGRNFYSCPNGPEDYWPMYGKVIAIDDGQLVMFEFQCDKEGKYMVEPHHKRISLWSGYSAISEAAFRAAWLQMVERMNAAASAAILQG